MVIRLFGVSVSSYVFLFSYVPVSLFIVTCMDVCIWVIANICMASHGQEQEVSGNPKKAWITCFLYIRIDFWVVLHLLYSPMIFT